jgi:predicted metal-dependent HD superfamily phosphohydrolase
MKMDERFKKFWNPAHAETVWRIWRVCHVDPARYYHTLEHIQHALDVFDHVIIETPLTEENRRTAELALFWHDAIYVAGDSMNEVISASLLEGLHSMLAPFTGHISIAADIIRCTRHHPLVVDTTYCAVFDCDLAILGSYPHVYDGYVWGVRAEYGRFSDEEWRKGRVEFLKAMLARPRIYRLPEMRDHFEERARQNMERELRSRERKKEG